MGKLYAIKYKCSDVHLEMEVRMCLRNLLAFHFKNVSLGVPQGLHLGPTHFHSSGSAFILFSVFNKI